MTSYEGAAYRYGLVRERDDAAKARPRLVLDSPRVAGEFFVSIQTDDGREHFRVAFLDARRCLIGWLTVSVGCLTASLVHPREVFGPALVAGAASIVVTHNHPSGDLEPSTEDLALTRRLAACGATLGVELCDHIITGNGQTRTVSLKEKGVL